MTILKAHFPSGADFLARYLPELGEGGIFFPPAARSRSGSTSWWPFVSDAAAARRIRGQVAWRRPGKHSTKIKAGIGIQFLGSDAQARDYLLGVARGDSAEMVARRHQRLPVELPVLWQVPGALQDNAGILRDIGRGGAFIRTEDPIPSERDIVLKVSPPGAEVAMPLSARVAWRGHPNGEHGFGVEWKARDAGGTRRIKELVRRIEALWVYLSYFG